MSDVSFSQNVVDAIGIIIVVTFSLCIMFLVGILIYHYYKVEKPKHDLEMKDLKLKIQLHENAIEWNKKHENDFTEVIED